MHYVIPGRDNSKNKNLLGKQIKLSAGSWTMQKFIAISNSSKRLVLIQSNMGAEAITTEPDAKME